jgi:hypothetical protein
MLCFGCSPIGGWGIHAELLFSRQKNPLRISFSKTNSVSRTIFTVSDIYLSKDKGFHTVVFIHSFIYSCSCDLQLAPQWAVRHGTSQDIELKYVSSIKYMS